MNQMTIKKWVTCENPIEQDLKPVFWSYFHNKMMMLLMMIEHPYISRDVLSVEKQKIFLHDVYHHFLPSKAAHKYRLAFKWIDLFLSRFPDNGPRDILKAIDMVGLIYEVFGFRLGARTEEVRLASEMQRNGRKGV